VRAELEAYELASIAPAAPAARRAPGLGPPGSAPPLRVRAAAGFFGVVGALGLLLLAMGGLLRALGVPPYAQASAPPGGLALALLTCVGYLLTGRSLAAGERRGALAAALTLGVPVLVHAVAAQPLGAWNVAVAGLGALLVAAAWRDLR
jgi:hypothetical protein